jgi:hypothetical protein
LNLFQTLALSVSKAQGSKQIPTLRTTHLLSLNLTQPNS